MVKHVILWTLKDDYSGVEVDKIKSEIKAGLEGLGGKIPGLIDIRVVTEGLSSSNTDLMLVSTFENFDALKGYSKNPLHVEVANSKVRPFTASRNCFDYEV
ncbi:MAG: Dabb family protein [Lachnospiraceae bacterium]|nr:Dabb family protein [Lachnospiraceae bacterium]